MNDNLEENLLDDEGGATGRNTDILAHGEKISESLGKFKAASPIILAT